MAHVAGGGSPSTPHSEFPPTSYTTEPAGVPPTRHSAGARALTSCRSAGDCRSSVSMPARPNLAPSWVSFCVHQSSVKPAKRGEMGGNRPPAPAVSTCTTGESAADEASASAMPVPAAEARAVTVMAMITAAAPRGGDMSALQWPLVVPAGVWSLYVRCTTPPPPRPLPGRGLP